MFDEETSVFDDQETGGAGFFGGCRVGDFLLEPEGFGFDSDSGVGHGRDIFGAAENVDDVDGFRDVFETRKGFMAQHFRFVGIDGDDAIARRLEVGCDLVRGARRIRRQTNHGDGFGIAEEIGNGVRSGARVLWEVDSHGDWMNGSGIRIEEIGAQRKLKSQKSSGRKEQKKKKRFATEDTDKKISRGSG
jgi:hypothetical protein